MKLKVFDTDSSIRSAAILEKAFNTWAEENADCTIVETRTSANEYRFLLYVFYTKNPTL